MTTPISLTNTSACPLLLNFMNGISNSDKGGDAWTTNRFACCGNCPDFTVPVQVIPSACRHVRNKSSTYAVGSQTAIHYLLGFASTGIVPTIMFIFRTCSGLLTKSASTSALFVVASIQIDI